MWVLIGLPLHTSSFLHKQKNKALFAAGDSGPVFIQVREKTFRQTGETFRQVCKM